MVEEVGERLARLMAMKGMSQSELSRRSGVSRTHICKVVSGDRRKLRLSTVVALARGLGVRPEIFLASKDSEWLYTSTHVFEGILKELRNGYGFGSKAEDG